MNKHPVNHVIRLVALLLFCSVARADFPYVTFTNSFKAAELSDSYTNFNWTLNDFTDYQISVRFDTVGYSNVIFRMAYPQGGNAYLTLYGGIVTTNTTSTLYTASIDHTNIPRNASYFAEFLAANINVSTNYVTNYTPVRILSKGKVETKWSVFSATNNVQTNINIQLHVGTNISLSESDPIWSAEKAGYATGTPLYVNTALSQGYIPTGNVTTLLGGYATGTPLYVETYTGSVGSIAGLATGTPLYVESDPIWIAASNGVGTNLVNLLANSTAMQAFTNTYAHSDSSTNYAFRNVYQAFTANYASALSSTGFAVRTVYQAFTAAYATANSTTNFMPFIKQNVSNAAMAVRLTGVETNLAANLTSVVYRTGGIISGPVTGQNFYALSDGRYWMQSALDSAWGSVWFGEMEYGESSYNLGNYSLADANGNICWPRISSALVGESVRLGSLTMAMQQYGSTVLTNGAMNTTNEWNYTGNASWGAASNITFAAGAGTATYIYTNNITVPVAWLLTYSHNGASGTNYVTNLVGGIVQGVATVTTVSATYSNWCYVRNQTLEMRGTPGDAVYVDNLTLRRDTNGDVRVANRLDAYQAVFATRPIAEGYPMARSSEVAQVRTDIGTASNALNIAITNVAGNLNVASNALNIAQTNTDARMVLTSNWLDSVVAIATNNTANNVTTSNRAEAAYALADEAPTYAESSNSFLLATGETRSITINGGAFNILIAAGGSTGFVRLAAGLASAGAGRITFGAQSNAVYVEAAGQAPIFAINARGGLSLVQGTNTAIIKDGAFTMNGVAIGGGSGDTFATNMLRNLADAKPSSAPTANDVLIWNGAVWTNAANAAGGATGVVSTATITGQYNSASQQLTLDYVGAAPGGLTLWTERTNSLCGGSGFTLDSSTGFGVWVCANTSLALNAYSGAMPTNSVNLSPFGIMGSTAGGSFMAGGHWTGISRIDSIGSSILGGEQNSIYSLSRYSVIGGGLNNIIAQTNVTAPGGFIGGGQNNRITGADSRWSGIVAGSDGVVMNSFLSSILVGLNCSVSNANYGIAAGNNAQSRHLGARVFGDGTGVATSSAETNQFLIAVRGSGLTLQGNRAAHPTSVSGQWFIYQIQSNGLLYVMNTNGTATQIGSHNEYGDRVLADYDAVTGITRTRNMDAEREAELAYQAAAVAAWRDGKNFSDVQAAMLKAEEARQAAYVAAYTVVKTGPTWAENESAKAAKRDEEIAAWEALDPADKPKQPKPPKYESIPAPARPKKDDK